MPAPHGAARRAYIANQVATASPARLLTMLYDALVSDLATAAAAIEARDFETSGTRLLRAQAIVLELQASLRLDVWDGAQGLLAVYHYLYRRLVQANTTADAAICAECLTLVTPLQQAWHQAAAQVAAEGASSAQSA